MENAEFRGDLSSLPFAALLGRIWSKQASGRLSLDLDGTTLILSFERGGMGIEQESFPGAEFLDWLSRRQRLNASILDCFRSLCSRNNRPPLRGILESGLLQPAELWEELELFWKERLYPVFDRARGTYHFETPEAKTSVSLVRPLSLPPIIVEGIRRMKDPARIAACLSGDDRKIRSLSPYRLPHSEFEPHVLYVLDLLAVPRTPKELCAASLLGVGETRKILFALMCLGAAVETGSPGQNAARTAQDLSLTEMERLFGIFNDRCSYIYKYISKELGPVAMNVIEKAFADIRDRIDPALQSFSLTPEGKVEFRPFLRMNINVATEDRRRAFLRSLDEILSAGVLAVKKTLGSEHEADVVRNLEKMGELP
jgi:hypothetical protein